MSRDPNIWINTRDTSWYSQAICASTDPEAWVPDHPDPAHTRMLKRICNSCPVQTQCAAYAIANNFSHGIWGGLTPRERTQMRKQLP